MRPCFITIEGIEGVGKSTVLTSVQSFLQEKQVPHLMTREPGGTVISEAIRCVLLSHYAETMATDTELLLVFAARAQHIHSIIRPALEKGLCVISDRFTDASYAYQGGGRGIESSRIHTLETWVQRGLQPDLTILLDAPLDIAFARATSRSLPDRIEQEGKSFFERVRSAYLARAAEEPNRFRIIDANRPQSAVEHDVLAVISQQLALCP